MSNRSRSTLFLIEQLIVIAVFAVSAAACTGILTSAYFTAMDSRDTSRAILAAENGAESFKATGGDLGKTAQILGGTSGRVDGEAAAIVYFDKQWQTSSEEDAMYRMLLTGVVPDTELDLLIGDLFVEKLTGELLIAFPIAVRGEAG